MGDVRSKLNLDQRNAARSVSRCGRGRVRSADPLRIKPAR